MRLFASAVALLFALQGDKVELRWKFRKEGERWRVYELDTR